MIREKMVEKLNSIAPLIIDVTMTYDMGYEFTAVVPNGVIFAIPGMLLNYSGGEWPPAGWDGKNDREYEKLMNDFLLDEEWDVISWEHLSDEEISNFYDEALSIMLNKSYGTLKSGGA